MDRATWLEERRKGIGGSDAAAVVGRSPWKTPLQVYLEKRGEAEPEPENESMRWGSLLEPVIRERFSEESGRAVEWRPNWLVQHPKFPWMLASLDGLSEGEGYRRLFEAKTARSDAEWGEPGSDEVPEQYLLQVQHAMAVTGASVADIAVLFFGSDFRRYEVPADAELQEVLIEREAAFWERIVKGEPPEPTTYADAVALFGRRSSAGEVLASTHIAASVTALKALQARRKALEMEEDRVRAEICGFLGEFDTLTDGSRILATWKAAKAPERFDKEAFQAAHPDLCREFTKPGTPSRRLLLK